MCADVAYRGGFVKLALVPVILSMVAIAGHRTCLAITLNGQVVIVDEWDRPVIIVDEKAVTRCPPPMGQREKQAQHERTEAERRRAEAERKRQEQEAEKQRLLAETQRKWHGDQTEKQRLLAEAQRKRQQQQQAEEERKRDEILSGKVDGLLKFVVAAQRETNALQERAEASRQQTEAATKRQTDTALLQTAATASSGTRNSWFFVLGGLVVVIAAVYYTTRSIRGPVGKVAGGLKVVAADVKKMSQAMQNIEDAAQREREPQQERAEPQRQKVQIPSGKVDNPPKVVTAAAGGDLTKEVEIEGDELIDDLAATMKEMLEEVSKRNRADQRYQAGAPDSLDRGRSRGPAAYLIPIEEGGSRSEPGRKWTDRPGDRVGGEKSGRTV